MQRELPVVLLREGSMRSKLRCTLWGFIWLCQAPVWLTQPGSPLQCGEGRSGLKIQSNKNKNKLSKQLEQEKNHRMEITWMVISGERDWEGAEWGKGTGNKKHKW